MRTRFLIALNESIAFQNLRSDLGLGARVAVILQEPNFLLIRFIAFWQVCGAHNRKGRDAWAAFQGQCGLDSWCIAVLPFRCLLSFRGATTHSNKFA